MLEQAEDMAMKSNARRSELDAQIQNCRLLLTEIEKKVHERQTQKFEAQSEVQRKEGEIQKINFEIEQARRNEQMTGNILQELEIRKVAIETDLAQAKIRHEAASTEAERALVGFEEQQAILNNTRQILNDSDALLIEKRRAVVTTDQAKAHIQAQVNSGEGRLGELHERLERSRAVLGELEAKQNDFERARKKYFEDLEVRCIRVPAQIAELWQHERIDGELHDRDHHAGRQMDRDADLPLSVVEREPPAQPQNERADGEPQVTGKQLPRQHTPERRGILG